MKRTRFSLYVKTAITAMITINLLTQSVDALAAKEAPLPSSFDLRERGVVTSVKSQEPFNSCWAFGGTAAAETSILSELGMTTEQYKNRYGKEFDLSEKHLAWWAYHSLPAEDDEDEKGEGVHLFGEGKVHNRNLAYEIGGLPYIADEMYAVGVGPVFDGYAPYVGFTGGGKKSYGFGADWTLPDKTRYHFSYELLDGNRLPSPSIYKTTNDGVFATDKKGDYIYLGYDEEATKAIKKEIFAGRGVAISYRADISTSRQREGGLVSQKYLSENWAQYTDDRTDANHVICVVGWDDDYGLENFNSDRQPPAPGAWLCKNSWGSGEASESSHNYLNEWGILDENGVHTGYFWLSYYDHTICEPESLRFSVSKNTSQNTVINAHDYMQGGETLDFAEKTENKMANVFTAKTSQRLRAVGTDTVAPNTKVRFDVYELTGSILSPTRGKHIATKTATFKYAGFHRVALGRSYPLQEGERFSVVVTQTTSEKGVKKYRIVSSYGAGEKVAKKWGLPYYSKAVVNDGESYYGYRDKSGKFYWQDWAAMVESWKRDPKIARLEIDNFPIKAYSTLVK